MHGVRTWGRSDAGSDTVTGDAVTGDAVPLLLTTGRGALATGDGSSSMMMQSSGEGDRPCLLQQMRHITERTHHSDCQPGGSDPQGGSESRPP